MEVRDDVGQLDRTVRRRQLASDPDRVDQAGSGDQVAVVGPADDPQGM